jgi:hypothetical protein
MGRRGLPVRRIISVVSEIERLRRAVDEASRSVAPLARTVEQLTEARARAVREAESAERELDRVRREAESVGFVALLKERIVEGWGFLGKLLLSLPMLWGALAVIGGIVAVFTECGEDVTPPLTLEATGTRVQSFGPLTELGAPCTLSVTRIAPSSCRAIVSCDREELYAGEVGCVLENRCEGDGDSETCWDAVVVRDDELGHGFAYDTDLAVLDLDASGELVRIAVHDVSFSGAP